MKNNLLSVYGLLKRGFVLDLNRYGAKFIGEGIIVNARLYQIGQGVGLRFGKDPLEVGDGCRFHSSPNIQPAHAEVFEIPNKLWEWLDEIESNGFAYTRKIAPVMLDHDDEYDPYPSIEAWVYEHTFPGTRYNKPILSGIFEDGPHPWDCKCEAHA